MSPLKYPARQRFPSDEREPMLLTSRGGGRLIKFSTRMFRPEVQLNPCSLNSNFWPKRYTGFYIPRRTEKLHPFYTLIHFVVRKIWQKSFCLITVRLKLTILSSNLYKHLNDGPATLSNTCWKFSWPFSTSQLVKSRPVHIPLAWKRHPFRAEFIIGSSPGAHIRGSHPLDILSRMRQLRHNTSTSYESYSTNNGASGPASCRVPFEISGF